ncbi:primosomal protein [uncultured Demequina sp.]|uniref:primosomal protein n=1 Tax=uncultured Demequina sp. TaxID=693499 RepID=UPI0025E65DA7|nr:primosomal protein [uncultured Demequina sp.]
MSTDAREALRRLVAALEEHLGAVTTRRGATDAAVDDAYEAVASAFEEYEAALDVEYAETLPVVLDEDFDDGEDSNGDDEDDEELDAHAAEDEDDMDDDIEDFDLR